MTNDADTTDKQLYVLFLWAGIEPDLRGPYSSDNERREAARTFGTEHDSVVLIDASGPIEVTTLGSWEFAAAASA